MPLFDIIVLAILVISGGLGFYQGGVREMVSAVSFMVAAAAAVYGLRFTGPMAQGFIHPDWVGTAAAVVISFVIFFAGLRLVASGISHTIRKVPVLGALDRSVGLGFGLLRAFVFLGACNLVFNAATPVSLRPAWLAQSSLYPLTETAGLLLRQFAPQGMDAASQLTPALSRAVLDGSMKPKRDSGDVPGYDAGARGGIDDLVENAR